MGSWALDRFHPSRPCWRRLVLAWERLTRSKSTKPLLHKHSPARRLWTSPWRSSTHVGAVALGHPLAASGSRISAHLVHKLRRNGEKYGIGSACIGGGQGIAILFERV